MNPIQSEWYVFDHARSYCPNIFSKIVKRHFKEYSTRAGDGDDFNLRLKFCNIVVLPYLIMKSLTRQS
jgi:hypothetical protein